MPGFPVHHQLPELAQTHVHQVGDAMQPSHPLSCPSPPVSIFPSIRVFSSNSVLSIRWPKNWSFSFSISPSNEYSGLISFRIDWFELLVYTHTHTHTYMYMYRASLVAQMVNHLPGMWETQVRPLGWEDPLEKEMAIHSSTLTWKIPWSEEPGRLQTMGSLRVRHNRATSLSLFPFIDR